MREVKDAVRRIERIAKNGERAQKGRDKKIDPTPSFPNHIPPGKKKKPSAKKLNPHSPEKPPKQNQKKRPPHKFQSANRKRFWNLPPKNPTKQAFNHFQSQLPESHTEVWKTRGWIGGLQHSHHKKKRPRYAIINDSTDIDNHIHNSPSSSLRAYLPTT